VDKVLRAVALVVTDRRWAAPLSAMALGFGLFVGVAIGPGASGTLATGAAPIIALAPAGADDGGGAAESTGGGALEGGGEAEFAEAEPEPFEAPPLETAYAPEPAPPEPAPREEAPAEEAEPAPEEEAEGKTQLLKGTVVHANPAAESYTLAIAGGELVAVHAEKLPSAGTRASVEVEPLGNSTFGELERERTGEATRATFRGVVTYADPDPADPAYTVSGRGASILVHAPPAAELPELGAYVDVEARIEKVRLGGEGEESEAADVGGDAAGKEAADAAAPGEVATDPAASGAAACLADPELETPAPAQRVVQAKLKAEPEPAAYVDLAGILTAVCPSTGQVLLSADDLRAGGADLVLAVPKRLKTAKLSVGDSLLATAEVGAGGALTLAGLASDEGRKGAEDSTSAQGDLAR
jgi:hypothetical protein